MRIGNPLNKKDLKKGKIVTPRIKEINPSGFTLLEAHNGGILEDVDGDFYLISIIEMCREKYNELPDIPSYDSIEKWGIKLDKRK